MSSYSQIPNFSTPPSVTIQPRRRVAWLTGLAGFLLGVLVVICVTYNPLALRHDMSQNLQKFPSYMLETSHIVQSKMPSYPSNIQSTLWNTRLQQQAVKQSFSNPGKHAIAASMQVDKQSISSDCSKCVSRCTTLGAMKSYCLLRCSC